jgi:hypothetical protein
MDERFVLYISAFILRENLKTVRLFGFRTDVPTWVLTNTKSEHTNWYFCFLIFYFTTLNNIKWTERTKTTTEVTYS